jgi:hypothetical protein
MAATVIPFSRHPQSEPDDERDFEAWEAYVDVYERGDFPGLVRLCEATLRRWPDDVNAQATAVAAGRGGGASPQALRRSSGRNGVTNGNASC